MAKRVKKPSKEIAEFGVYDLIPNAEYTLGLDVSLRCTGVTVFDDTNNRPIMCYKIITTKEKGGNDFDDMSYITDSIIKIARKYNIREAILEGGYGGVNKMTAIQLAETRSAVKTGLRFLGKKIYEYPIITVKFGLVKANRIEKDGKYVKMEITKEMIANHVIEQYPDFENKVGAYSDKSNSDKTSDMYDSTSLCIFHKKKVSNESNTVKV